MSGMMCCFAALLLFCCAVVPLWCCAGGWVNDMMSGLGKKIYARGDMYEGAGREPLGVHLEACIMCHQEKCLTMCSWPHVTAGYGPLTPDPLAWRLTPDPLAWRLIPDPLVWPLAHWPGA